MDPARITEILTDPVTLELRPSLHARMALFDSRGPVEHGAGIAGGIYWR